MKAIVLDGFYTLENCIGVAVRDESGRSIPVHSDGSFAAKPDSKYRVIVSNERENLIPVWLSGKHIFLAQIREFTIRIKSGRLQNAGNCFALFSLERGRLVLYKISVQPQGGWLKLSCDKTGVRQDMVVAPKVIETIRH
ncbi:hypothetical protein A3I27_03565 [Candidatus Giovannonibacteria bacterium RIFCSPLOWO2_02_FULL_43_11b]|uniref:Uncharacterized protein n=1 Tax=Candidatus Giovannonibacteria bacterium RIFCSPHIGHO2_12_FULL_43_15 TaxID=1798341 RepID=A0A1F5WPY9_9BACT|nr:MAG: hypothetical protein A3F23_01560 [Candidatus Giovannonibacteria bacterium RIFCSPHIGHO2_12_FULL_43_15]OGF89332.1 MAG: hypothetical protein A3I27_03565 [Candidatus Giovannonibacteria bacterium RIFCSPLOWO2_02_FULL_43_11b]